MNYALIGCGRIAQNHIQAAIQNSFVVTAVCDLDASKAKELLKKNHLGDEVHIYTNYHLMLQSESVEVVAIATESGKHAMIAIDCMNAGCHVIIEKPMALSIQDADKIIECAKRQNVKVTVCHQNRFNRCVQELRKAMEQGWFGKVYYGNATIRWARDASYYKHALWRGTWQQDGGALMNQCIHDIDLLLWMMGSNVKQVVGITQNMKHEYIEAEDLGMAILTFENGCSGLIEGTTDVYPDNLEETLCIFGEKGTVKLGGTSLNQIIEWRFEDETADTSRVKESTLENPQNVYGFGHTLLYQDMNGAIQCNRLPYISAEDGKKAVEVILAIYLSSTKQKMICLPLKQCATVDFTGIFS